MKNKSSLNLSKYVLSALVLACIVLVVFVYVQWDKSADRVDKGSRNVTKSNPASDKKINFQKKKKNEQHEKSSSSKRQTNNLPDHIHPIRINVVDQQGNPIKDVRVYGKIFSSKGEDFLGMEKQYYSTDNNGTCTLKINTKSKEFSSHLNSENSRVIIFSRHKKYVRYTREATKTVPAENLPDRVQLVQKRGRYFKPAKLTGISEDYFGIFKKEYTASLEVKNSDQSFPLRITSNGKLVSPRSRVSSEAMQLIVRPYGSGKTVSDDYKYKAKYIDIPEGEPGGTVNLGTVRMEPNPEYREKVTLIIQNKFDYKKHKKFTPISQILFVYSIKKDKFLLEENLPVDKGIYELSAEGTFIIYIRYMPSEKSDSPGVGWYWKKTIRADRGSSLEFKVEPKRSLPLHIKEYNTFRKNFDYPNDSNYKFYLENDFEKQIPIRLPLTAKTKKINGTHVLITTFDPATTTLVLEYWDINTNEQRIKKYLKFSTGRKAEVQFEIKDN